MKSKLLIIGLFIVFSSFTSKSGSDVELKKNDSFQIGYFYASGYYFDAWGDGGGNITSVYLTDSNGNHIGDAYSWSGSYTPDHWIDISVQVTSTGSPITFNGYCWF